MYVAIDKFTKWPEVEAVRKVTTQSAVKFFEGLVCHFGVPNWVITDNGTQFTRRTFMQYIQDLGNSSIQCLPLMCSLSKVLVLKPRSTSAFALSA